jgi:hypothetical protein
MENASVEQHRLKMKATTSRRTPEVAQQESHGFFNQWLRLLVAVSPGYINAARAATVA